MQLSLENEILSALRDIERQNRITNTILNEIYLNTKKRTSEPREKVKVSSIILRKTYLEEFEKKYRVKPATSARFNGQIAHIAQQIPEAEHEETVRYFFTLNDPWYKKEMHSVGCLLKDIQKINTMMKKGMQSVDLSTSRSESLWEKNMSIADQYLGRDEK